MRNTSYREQSHRGFSLIELVFVIAVGLILAAMAIPTYLTIRRNLRIGGDARDVNGEIVLAKMRAASDFTRARLYADLSANTYHIEVWNKAGAGSWAAEGGTIALSQGVTFGHGGLGTPPAGTQASIGQAPACLNNAGASIANTACIVFNSRGIPIDSTLAPTPNGAFYVTDGVAVCGVTVSAMGLIQTWRSDTNTANWKKF
jgi:prepilin-type N-terminal cleavage/methylation domain-containing protein